MIETPTAIFDVRAIAAHPRVAVLVMGTNDLAKELRAPIVPGRHPLLPHLATALLAAREAGKVILDGVYNDVKNPDGFDGECAQGVEMGFDGKTLIHPEPGRLANDVWAPSADEVDYARAGDRRVRRGASPTGAGVVTVDGRMIENLHVANARRVLAVAAAIDRPRLNAGSFRPRPRRTAVRFGPDPERTEGRRYGRVMAARMASNAASA